jgi:hypothetical protein
MVVPSNKEGLYCITADVAATAVRFDKKCRGHREDLAKAIAQPETITSIGMRDWTHVGQPL